VLWHSVRTVVAGPYIDGRAGDSVPDLGTSQHLHAVVGELEQAEYFQAVIVRSTYQHHLTSLVCTVNTQPPVYTADRLKIKLKLHKAIDENSS